MATTADLTAAPGEVRLAGRTFRMSPLRDRDYGEFERWMQSRPIELAKQNLEGLGAEERAVILKHAFDRAARLTMGSPEAIQYMTCREGAARLVWLGIRHHHDDVTLEQVMEWMADERTVREAMDKIDELNRLEEQAARKKRKPRGRASVAIAAEQTVRQIRQRSTAT